MRNRLKESLPRITRLFLYIWLGTICTFILGLVTWNLASQPWPDTFSKLLLGIVLLGVLSFILMCVFAFFGAAIRPEERKVVLVKPRKSNKPKTSNRLSHYLAGGVAVLIIVGGFLHQRAINLENVAKVKNYETLKETATLSPTTTPEVKGASVKPAIQNTNPIINCGISAECGGGSRQMKKSECLQTTCCQIGNKWYFYLSKDKCIQDQKNSQPQQAQAAAPQIAPTTNKVPVFLTYGNYTIYCPPQNVDAVKSIDATMTSKGQEWAKNALTCSDNFMNSDPCYINCKSVFHSDWDICAAAYGYSGSNYDACTKEVSRNYGTCLGTCPSTAAACDWVYGEQRNLTSQIGNLCN